MNPILSICIATYNRGHFISETLDSILGQLEPGIELVIVDGASPDNTPEVLAQYAENHPQVRYFREIENSGVDLDYDKAVVYAKGKYCWLMTDDDLIKPGAILKVLAALENEYDLLVVNAEVRNFDLSEVLLERRMNINEDLKYRDSGADTFFSTTAEYLAFIGAVVIRREVWLSRVRSDYFGTLFVHVGVIFQQPLINNIKVIADPIISIRNGNAMWTPRGFEIWSFKWPQLIWTFRNFSDDTKKTICRREPWRNIKYLIFQRALGVYSISEFKKYLQNKSLDSSLVIAYLTAAVPGIIANFIAVSYFVFVKRSAKLALYDVMRSRYVTAASRFLVRSFSNISIT